MTSGLTLTKVSKKKGQTTTQDEQKLPTKKKPDAPVDFSFLEANQPATEALFGLINAADIANATNHPTVRRALFRNFKEQSSTWSDSELSIRSKQLGASLSADATPVIIKKTLAADVVASDKTSTELFGQSFVAQQLKTHDVQLVILKRLASLKTYKQYIEQMINAIKDGKAGSSERKRDETPVNAVANTTTVQASGGETKARDSTAIRLADGSLALVYVTEKDGVRSESVVSQGGATNKMVHYSGRNRYSGSVSASSVSTLLGMNARLVKSDQSDLKMLIKVFNLPVDAFGGKPITERTQSSEVKSTTTPDQAKAAGNSAESILADLYCRHVNASFQKERQDSLAVQAVVGMSFRHEVLGYLVATPDLVLLQTLKSHANGVSVLRVVEIKYTTRHTANTADDVLIKEFGGQVMLQMACAKAPRGDLLVAGETWAKLFTFNVVHMIDWWNANVLSLTGFYDKFMAWFFEGTSTKHGAASLKTLMAYMEEKEATNEAKGRIMDLYNVGKVYNIGDPVRNAISSNRVYLKYDRNTCRAEFVTVPGLIEENPQITSQLLNVGTSVFKPTGVAMFSRAVFKTTQANSLFSFV
jgi:hypothetical protein